MPFRLVKTSFFVVNIVFGFNIYFLLIASIGAGFELFCCRPNYNSYK